MYDRPEGEWENNFFYIPGVLWVEPVSLECRLYPREDLGELPVLYPDARHQG